MKVKTITISRRLPTEQYGYVDVQATAELTASEDTAESIQELRSIVELGLGIGAGAESEAEETEEQEEEKPTKKTAKKASKKVEEETEEEEESEDEESDEEEESEEETEEEEEEEKPAKKAAKKTTASPGKKRKMGATYDREDAVHKTLIGEMLNANFPNWTKKGDLKAKAKSISVKMDGKEFQDAEGDILESFSKEFIRQMKSK